MGRNVLPFFRAELLAEFNRRFFPGDGGSRENLISDKTHLEGRYTNIIII